MFSRCAVVVLGLLLAACATRGPAVVAVSPAFEAPYTLDAGDRLRVVVFGQPGLTNCYSVDASGKIAMPLIGLVDARGSTVAELQKDIQARLRQGYMREPNVAVEVETYRPSSSSARWCSPGSTLTSPILLWRRRSPLLADSRRAQ